MKTISRIAYSNDKKNKTSSIVVRQIAIMISILLVLFLLSLLYAILLIVFI